MCSLYSAEVRKHVFYTTPHKLSERKPIIPDYNAIASKCIFWLQKDFQIFGILALSHETFPVGETQWLTPSIGSQTSDFLFQASVEG